MEKLKKGFQPHLEDNNKFWGPIVQGDQMRSSPIGKSGTVTQFSFKKIIKRNNVQ